MGNGMEAGRRRAGGFREIPTVLLLDEAHKFLDKSLGDEYSRVVLDWIGVVANDC